MHREFIWKASNQCDQMLEWKVAQIFPIVTKILK